jgi:hypothetical protein
MNIQEKELLHGLSPVIRKGKGFGPFIDPSGNHRGGTSDSEILLLGKLRRQTRTE